MSSGPQDPERAAPLIPGAYERNTLTYRQLGSMGASPSAAMPASPCSMDAATIADREREGGGAPSQRRRRAASPGSNVFTALFAALGMWLVFQLLAPSLLP